MVNSKNKSMIKKLFLISLMTALIYFTPSCNDKDKKPVGKPGIVKLIAVYTDSGVIRAAIIIRQINKVVKVDSITGKETIVTDTLYGIEKQFPKLDSLRKPIKDSSGKIQYQLIPVVIPKDSVNTHIENIPVEILMDRKQWKKQTD